MKGVGLLFKEGGGKAPKIYLGKSAPPGENNGALVPRLPKDPEKMDKQL